MNRPYAEPELHMQRLRAFTEGEDIELVEPGHNVARPVREGDAALNLGLFYRGWKLYELVVQSYIGSCRLSGSGRPFER